MLNPICPPAPTVAIRIFSFGDNNPLAATQCRGTIVNAATPAAVPPINRRREIPPFFARIDIS
jgi:hypothetical protein